MGLFSPAQFQGAGINLFFPEPGHFRHLGGDIVDVSQTLVGGYFTMILIVDLSGLAQNTSFVDFRNSVLQATESLGLQAMLMHEDVLRAMHRV